MNEFPDSPPENQFYEHLTELIRLFKSLFLAFDDTLTLMRNDDDYDHSVLRLRKIISEETQLAERYDLSLEPHCHLHRQPRKPRSAYQRFVCRLTQNLAPSKAKGGKEDQPVPLAEQYMLLVENCINYHRKERNVARLFRRIFAYTQKFCEGCDMLLSCCSQNEAIQLLRKEAEEDREKKQQVKLQARPPLQSQSESAFHKIMMVYNKRFTTISCLDLDYNSYKAYCYMSRSDTDDQLFKDFINRNTTVSRAIIRYSKNFVDYLRRKQKTILRRNRFRELKEIKNGEHLESQHQNIYSRQNIEDTKKSRTLFDPKTQESPIICLPTLQEQKKRILQPQKSQREEPSRGGRGNYQLKSIYLTINKCHDKFQAMNATNRFMFNYSLPKPQDSSKKYPTLKVNDNSLKSTQIINNDAGSSSILMHYDRNDAYESLVCNQMLYQSKMAISPRASIIHKYHKEKKSDKRNIRITNLTFRGPNYSKLSSIIDPENTTIS